MDTNRGVAGDLHLITTLIERLDVTSSLRPIGYRIESAQAGHASTTTADLPFCPQKIAFKIASAFTNVFGIVEC